MSRSILLGAALIVIFLFLATYGGLTATPKFWHDEAVPFEIARNIAEFGKADLAITPNIFWEKSYMTHATGFPLTFPLAGIFKIFGVGVLQLRIFMIAWMLGMLAALFFIIRAFFDNLAVKPPLGGFTAFFSVLLVATFSSFYANGRTGTGEIPGFFFLLIALYSLYQKEWYGWGGFFAALAAVTKPSMYLLALPAITVELFICAYQTSKKNVFRDLAEKSQKIKDFVKKFVTRNKSNVFAGFEREAGTVRPSVSEGESEARNPERRTLGGARKAKIFGLFLVGSLPVLLFWLWLINPIPFSLASWQEMIAFYQNAFNAPSLLSQFPAAIPYLITHSTLLYFAALLAIIIFAWRKNLFSPTQNRLVIFLFLYGAASFFYFLRSPGWFRYLLGTELLILALLPAALERTMESIFTGLRARAGMVRAKRESEGEPLSQLAGLARKVKMLSIVLLVIILSQSAQYLLGAEIPSNTQSIEIAQFINKEILANDPAATIGIADFTPVAALIPADRKYQRVAVGGYNTFVGQHPLSLPPDRLPTYFVSTNPKKNIEYESVLKRFYQLYREANYNVLIYKKSSTDQSD